MAAPMTGNVDLGFVEKADAWRLRSHLFPSKVGGKPAWLSFKPLPTQDDLKCSVCGKTMVFLLQAYAPESDSDISFHRTVFIFICAEPACCKRNKADNFVVLRSQLARENDFYSATPPDLDHPSDNAVGEVEINVVCVICGNPVPGSSRCSKCQKRYYCCREHQAVDWKNGHKSACPNEDTADRSGLVTFEEYELVMEAEEEGESAEKTEEERMKEYEDYVASKGSGTLGQAKGVDKDLSSMAADDTTKDKVLSKFKQRVFREPEQVMRYDKGGEPLWLSSQGIPKQEDIPPCDCGAPRQFEFQIVPQLLIFLKVDKLREASLDWGTLVVYTCKNSCNIGNQYKKEFIWKQDISED